MCGWYQFPLLPQYPRVKEGLMCVVILFLVVSNITLSATKWSRWAAVQFGCVFISRFGRLLIYSRTFYCRLLLVCTCKTQSNTLSIWLLEIGAASSSGARLERLHSWRPFYLRRRHGFFTRHGLCGTCLWNVSMTARRKSFRQQIFTTVTKWTA